MAKDPIYKIIFLNQGQVFEIYARHVYQSDLWGFLEAEEFVFGERTEFSGVKRSFIPLHAIVRIDEVEKEGTGKISDAKGGNVTPFPYPPVAPKPRVD